MRRQLILRVVLCFVVGGLCFLVMNFFFVLKAVPSADHVEPSDTGLERNLNGDQFYWRHTALDFAVSPDGSLVAASIRTEPMHPFTNSDSRVVVIDARSCKLARE